jgi:hypothetical protein
MAPVLLEEPPELAGTVEGTTGALVWAGADEGCEDVVVADDDDAAVEEEVAGD